MSMENDSKVCKGMIKFPWEEQFKKYLTKDPVRSIIYDEVIKGATTNITGKTKKSNNTSMKTKTVLVIRSGLLQQIAAGKKLKKVDMTEKKQEPK